MTLVIKTAQLPTLIEKERTYLNTLQVRLYKNNVAPNPALDKSQFDPVVDSGLPATPPSPGFTAATLNADNLGELLGTAYTFTFNKDGPAFTVYGYYVTDPAQGDGWIYAEQLANPLDVTFSGMNLTLRLKKVMGTGTGPGYAPVVAQ